MNLKKKRHITPVRIIALSIIMVILIGTLLLSLPISSKNGISTDLLDSLFTATSATCVTGLSVFDTFSQWSLFGQIVILVLIQIGGLSFMTIVTTFSIFMHKQISLGEMKLLMQSAGTVRLEGIRHLIRNIVLGSLIVESAGALILLTRFAPEMGFTKGIYYSVFHSVSAFCNAGFDLMGFRTQYSSMTFYVNDPIINLTLMALITVGGLGFFVCTDIIQSRFSFRKFRLHTKIVLITTLFLLLSGALIFLILEHDKALSQLTPAEKLLAALFQSVTSRTAGFNSIPQTELTKPSLVFTMLLMFIGGSPGSTAGGIKTTTFAILIISTLSCVKNKNGTVMFKRKIDDSTVRQAYSIATIYSFLAIVATMLILKFENLSLTNVLFEVISAIGTAGLSLGISPMLGTASKVVLIILMYSGRLGVMSLMLALSDNRRSVPLQRPTEKILIG